jgi:PPP family 3-phenylpropionic acid transporter
VCAIYFAYFAYVGTHSPFLSLYFSAIGLSVAQIGLIMSLAPATRLIGPPFWGWVADRTQARLTVMRGCALLAIVALVGLAFAGSHFYAVAAFATLMFFANAGKVPITEAIALGVSGGDAARYSRLRAWGSIGFIVAVLGMAPVLESLGMQTLPAWLAAMMGGLIVATWIMPAGPVTPTEPASSQASAPVWHALKDPVLLAFFVSLFLMVYAHASYYAFFSLFLERHGYGKPAIGAFWAIAVVAEIVVFYASRPLFDRFSALALLAFSMLVAAVRFAWVGLSEGGLVAIVLTQTLHAVTFGVHHGAAQVLMHRWFEPARQARAQGLYSMIAYGLGGTLGGLGASALWVGWAPGAAFLGAGVAAFFGALAAFACGHWDASRRSRL